MVSAALCLGLGGAGAGLALSASASGSTRPSPPGVQVDSTGCMENGAGGRVLRGSCTYVLTDGQRLKCPLRFTHHLQTPASLERAKACRRLTPIRIPASWKPALKRLDGVEDCLARQGVTARGGPYFSADPPRIPIGELDVATTPMAIIAFYTDARAAQSAEPMVQSRVQRTGGSVQRHAAVSVVWMSRPSTRLTGAMDSCAFA